MTEKTVEEILAMTDGEVMQSAIEEYGSLELAKAEADRLKNMLMKTCGWQTISDFQSIANEGWCWIYYKGRVVEAYHDHKQNFRFHKHSDNVYMTECITHAMPWYMPPSPAISNGI